MGTKKNDNYYINSGAKANLKIHLFNASLSLCLVDYCKVTEVHVIFSLNVYAVSYTHLTLPTILRV